MMELFRRFFYSPIKIISCGFQNQALYALLGTVYGWDGRVTFGLPDLRDACPCIVGAAPDRALSPHQLGERRGLETNITNVAQMPEHNHGAELSNLNIGTISANLRASNQGANSNDPTGNALSETGMTTIYVDQAPNKDMHAESIQVTQGGTPSGDVTISPTGENKPANNMQPYLTINFCIALQGIYPSRN